MKAISTILFATLFVVGTANAIPIQWTEGNNHWYDVVWVEAGLSWEDAQNMAELSGGHLVTLTTPEENAMVWDLLNDNLEEGTEYRSYWLGGSQIDPTTGQVSDDWFWVTGEEWDYAPWVAGQPSNTIPTRSGNPQDYLHYWKTEIGEWDDMENGVHVGGYVIEYTEAPAVPEPSTMFLLGSGLLGLAGLRRKFNKS